jgi:hypothetical protein
MVLSTPSSALLFLLPLLGDVAAASGWAGWAAHGSPENQKVTSLAGRGGKGSWGANRGRPIAGRWMSTPFTVVLSRADQVAVVVAGMCEKWRVGRLLEGGCLVERLGCCAVEMDRR